jgi:hypothetical protein
METALTSSTVSAEEKMLTRKPFVVSKQNMVAVTS